MKPEIITIGGPPGSGTSTVSRRVASKLDYSRFSSGDFMRSLARERNMSLAEITEQAEQNPKIDEKIDEKVKNLADSEKIVVDSRLAFHFIPESFAVYLEVDLQTAAERIYSEHDQRKESGELVSDSVEKTRQSIMRRLSSERKRYKELYNIDHTNHTHYDLVVDTDTKGIPEVVQTVIDRYREWQKSIE
jgi:cytidylate kinase